MSLSSSTTEHALESGAPGRVGRSGPAVFSRRKLVLSLIVTFCVVAAATAFAASAAVRPRSTPPLPVYAAIRQPGLPATVSTVLANLMSLQPAPPRQAPGFTLTDQTGRDLSLSSLRGHPVVLAFMDPRSAGISPVVSQELVDAGTALRRAGTEASIVAVNVDEYDLSVPDVAAFSAAHGLTKIPAWHFFTGSAPLLRQIWSDYDVQVVNRGPSADVIDSSVLYFIGPNGKERYLAAPTDEKAKTGKAYLPAGLVTAWGQGIARVLESLAR